MKTRSFKAMGTSMIIASMIPWLAFMVYCTVTVQLYLPGLAEISGIPYASLLNWHTIGNLITVPCVLMASKIIQRFGPKKVIVVCSILCGLNYMLMPIYPGALMYLGVCLNPIVAVLYCSVPTPILMSNWYPRNHAHVMGNVTAIIILGSLVFLPLFNMGIGSVGLAKTMMISGIPMIVYGIVAIFWIKDTPAEVGLEPDGQAWTEDELEKAAAKAGEKSPWTVKSIFTNKSFMLVSIGWGFVFMALIGFSLVGINILTAKGMSQELAITLASLSGVVSMIGSVASGYISEKIGFAKGSVLFILSPALGCLLLFLAPAGSNVLLAVGYLLGMVMIGCANNLSTTAVQRLTGSRWYASVFGYCNAVTMLIRAFGTSLFSFSLTYLGGYNGALIISVALFVLAIILIRLGGDQYQTPPDEAAKKLLTR